MKFNFDENGLLKVTQSYMEELQQVQPKTPRRNTRSQGFGGYDSFFGGFDQSFNQGFGFGNRGYEQRPSPKQKKDLVKYDLQTQIFHPYAKEVEEINKLKSIEAEMLRKDKDIVESYEKKNALESLIYNSKEKLTDEAYKYFISN